VRVPGPFTGYNQSRHCKLVGNSTNEPAGFYFHLLRSIGDAPDRSKLSALHQWLAGKVSDDASMLSRPDTVIQELVRHGRTLGLPENGNSALAIQGGDESKKGNNCQYCSARPCRGRDNGGTKKACLVYNAQKPIPASASDNERNFVFQCRAYVDAVKPETLKGLAWKTITDKVKEIKPQVTPVVEGSNNTASSSGGAVIGSTTQWNAQQQSATENPSSECAVLTPEESELLIKMGRVTGGGT
jgi:hypothetical protein